MIEITTTRDGANAAINNAIKDIIMSNMDNFLTEKGTPFFQSTFLEDATLVKNQLVDTLSTELAQNFPRSFIESGDITKNSLYNALSLNVAQGEIRLIREELEINSDVFKKGRDFLGDELSSEDEWQDDYMGDLNNITDDDLNDLFETDSEEEEETKMYDFIEGRIKDKNLILSKLKNNGALKRFNTIWV